jgi:type IV pilus assembly protein PilB
MDQVLREAHENDTIEEVKEKREDIDLDRLAVESEDAPVVKIVNLILVQAMKEKASDIHIEPFEKLLKLRYRVDGNLVEAVRRRRRSITDRVAHQDSGRTGYRRAAIAAGRSFPHPRLGKEVDLRISILPTVHGEKIVIRLLDKGALSGSIDQLGMDEGT